MPPLLSLPTLSSPLSLRRWRQWLPALLATLLAGTALAAGSGVQTAPHIQVELISERARVAPGEPFTVALRLLPDAHWHTYWRNPGDSGLPTRIAWTLPAGASAGPIQWPAPQRLPVAHLVNYGFEGETLLLSAITPPRDLAAGATFAITAKADWLVCEEVCIPGSAELKLTLPVAATAQPAAQYATAFAAARAKLPQPRDWPARFEIRDGRLQVDIPGAPATADAQLFPAAADLVEHAAPQRVEYHGDGLRISQPLHAYFQNPPARFDAVLVADGAAYALTADVAATATAPTQPPLRLTAALGLALLGGLILNLMPCVFPVLSLKALSLAKTAGHARRERIDHALLYCAGVLCCFALIAAALLALRAGGAAVGWGFQLQNPWVVGALAYLMFALGLSLSGLVQFGVGWMDRGGSLARSGGRRGAFFTGVLAAVVASPCTAPFMGAALGYALAQPAPLALAVFMALGLGMALPFLLIALVPPLARLLPRPGAWMDTFKQVLAFPLYLTAAWLLWVLGRQNGADAMGVALLGLVALAAALWLWGRAQRGHPHPRRQLGGALGLAALAVFTLHFAGGRGGETAAAGHETWSESRLQALRAEGTPVFVNMTADWCITCLANERVALADGAVRAAFDRHGVAYLEGDWTRRDAAISRYLASFERSGVPLYVIYDAQGEPAVLPQLLTPALVIEALERATATGTRLAAIASDRNPKKDPKEEIP